MSVNFWFEHIIDAYLKAVAQGGDWRSACADAEQATKNQPVRVLTHKGRRAKATNYARQPTAGGVAGKTFPKPFNLPDKNCPTAGDRDVAGGREKRHSTGDITPRPHGKNL